MLERRSCAWEESRKLYFFGVCVYLHAQFLEESQRKLDDRTGVYRFGVSDLFPQPFLRQR